ncbi:tryptophan ABC transporter substrate-binding protein [Enterococcus caccae]|uniref:ABC transporter substrate-binding protein n=1 Tax=Enterococcus caccae ATCC BAA-1240 TaxID=1158612 RepID=R3TRL9_9ENTE|nr:tryptophan ABC transporter substrate-binding protein [Enterococcus caccae]EOL44234.1 ABC transporter substrate-binding protein [Enterococcus caccae ATCC BAA-1240]EOT68650.1 ABC transporter substrate-binding protein [Enterococcus caccae ATCC BAA-1240]OJG28133.1 ABC transporter substrate-binding protein [Enterococcus caccae]
MRKNRLSIVVVMIVIFLIGSFFVEKKEAAKEKLPTVGVLQFVSHPALDQIYKGIQAGLKEKGYEDGKNMVIAFQNGQADQSKLATMSQQLVQEKKADVLIGIATPAAQALANITTEIPIVLGAITDPVSAGLVKNNNQPGGNITGVSDKSPVAAQFDLVSEILPKKKKVGILYASSEENSKYQVEEAKNVAEKKGLTVKTYAVPSSNEIAQTVQVMTSEVDFIYIPTDNTIANAMQTVVNEANKTKTPIIPSVDTMVEQGGLATVGINQFDLGVQTGKMAADILSGKAKPETTPIYTFKTGDIIINQKQAEKLGISIPEHIKSKATITE